MARLRVKEIAKEKGFDATRLARESNVGYNVVLKLFNKPNHNATLETLQAIADALGVRVSDLLAEEPLSSESQSTN